MAFGGDYDVLIVGSGFGGSVSALRLTEKGYRVGVLEAGRRFEDHQFAKTSWRLREFLWAPKLGLFGIQRIHMLKDVMILGGAGVGGGSLNYANTLYKPPAPFFEDEQWAHITDWDDELSPYYDQARRMLGVVTNPTMTNSDEIYKSVADEMGVGHTFIQTPVGVFFGEKTGYTGKPDETVPDPYFGGVGPERTACTECGACMTGCRVGAKNTLLKNYLYLAEKNGAVVHDRTTVYSVEQTSDRRWRVGTVATGRWGGRGRRSRHYTADHVIFAAGAWGTQNLLHRLREDGRLPRISPRLGELTRTNSEALLGALQPRFDPRRDLSEGVAITSSFHPNEYTHVEPTRYGPGSNAMALLQTLMTDGGTRRQRFAQVVREISADPKLLLQLVHLSRWSQRTIITLVMQNRNNSLTTFLKKKGPLRTLSSRQGIGEPNPTWIPEGNEVTRRVAAKLDGGIAGGTWGEVFQIPLTAHFLGGCAISDTPDGGVVDPYQRMWNYPTLHIADGSAISANLGVNPALSITAQAERAMALWPNKGEDDPRPAQGRPYRTVTPVAPHTPTVPAGAQGELRLPLRVTNT